MDPWHCGEATHGNLSELAEGEMRCCWDRSAGTRGACTCHLLVPKAVLSFWNQIISGGIPAGKLIYEELQVPFTHPVHFKPSFYGIEALGLPFCQPVGNSVFSLGSFLTTTPWVLVLLFLLVDPKSQSQTISAAIL